VDFADALHGFVSAENSVSTQERNPLLGAGSTVHGEICLSMAVAMPRRPTYDREEHFSPESKAFLAWLRGQMSQHRFGDNQSKLATYLGTTLPTVNGWFTRGSRPRMEMCHELARVFGVPVEDVLRAAGHLPPDDRAPADRELPSWLTTALKELDEAELHVVKASVDALLELREYRARYEPRPQADPPPPAAPPAQPPPGPSPQ
jgi:DNA-binding XRE family transcriptional regulator